MNNILLKTSNNQFKIVKRFVYVFLLILFIPVILYFFSLQIVYANNVSYKNISVNCDNELDAEIYTVLDEACQKIIKSELYDSTIYYRFYLSSDYSAFHIFSPLTPGAFANANPYFVLFSKTNVKNNLITKNVSKPNQRKLADVISHEMTHKLIWNKIGFIKSKLLPMWKIEGYCDYISGASTINTDTALYLYANNKMPDNPMYGYSIAHACVKYLIEEEKMTYMDILGKEISQEQILKQILKNKTFQH